MSKKKVTIISIRIEKGKKAKDTVQHTAESKEEAIKFIEKHG